MGPRLRIRVVPGRESGWCRDGGCTLSSTLGLCSSFDVASGGGMFTLLELTFNLHPQHPLGRDRRRRVMGSLWGPRGLWRRWGGGSGMGL